MLDCSALSLNETGFIGYTFCVMSGEFDERILTVDYNRWSSSKGKDESAALKALQVSERG